MDLFKVKVLVLFIFQQLLGILNYAQDSVSLKFLYGIWKVENHISLIRTYLTEYEYNECLQSVFLINNNSISSNSADMCWFVPCDSLKIINIKILKRVPDTEQSKMNPGSMIEADSDFVDSSFLKLINYNEDNLWIINTNCSCDWGDLTLRICIINEKRIAFYCGADILILKKNLSNSGLYPESSGTKSSVK